MDEHELKRAGSKKKLGVFVVVLVVGIILALAFYYTAQPGDSAAAQVTVAVRGYLSVEQKEALQAQLNIYALKGEIPIPALIVYEFPAGADEDNETGRLLSQLKIEISSGRGNLYLLDRYVYDLLKDDTLFADLSRQYPDDSRVTDRYLYAMKGTAFAGVPALEGLQPLFWAIRNPENPAVNSDAGTRGEYTRQKALLDEIIH